MIKTRTEFKQWIKIMFPEAKMTSAKSALWIPEHDLKQTKCKWFVYTAPVRSASDVTKSDYWTWCNTNLQGMVRCFWSNSEAGEEIWGFTNHDDIQWWMLKWT